MRWLVASVLAGCAMALITPAAAWGQPLDCPPSCDRIPRSAWIAPTSIPLYEVYRWPELSGLAVTAVHPRFRFEELCGVPTAAEDPRAWAVTARAEATGADGQWRLRAQLMHWRGDAWQSGELASTVFGDAVAALRACQLTAPPVSPSVTLAEPTRVAAVLTSPDRSVLHQYLMADPRSGTIAELAMWSTPLPNTRWPAVSDRAVLDALAAPLCTAYVGSCR
ncbi:ATPase [Mycobacterium sp. PS03-16]|uniref:ATPase n=1 Tax=Mycobacterium sp. PS03-16 TaxID=2559611 RepID=UPI0010730640|nr:ATPase [Mycobacterium sp. PS03-16]TFV57218.1 ATPase [Mycobacterium sp. PS03-16]